VVATGQSLGKWRVFVGVSLRRSEKVGGEKSSGTKSSSSPTSLVQGNKKTHSAVQNGTVWGFSFFCLKQWMKRRHFGQNAPFHLKGNGGKIVSKSLSHPRGIAAERRPSIDFGFFLFMNKRVAT
jgi:hypothetical protein